MTEKLNSKLIETMSITKLKDALMRTGIVDASDIVENNTTPSWDGEIRIYKTHGDFSKGNLRGRIPIQVKGSFVEKFSKENKTSFPIAVSDLENYRTDHGAMFFWVQAKNFDEYKIFYAALLPFDLGKELNRVKNQKTRHIKLEPFPHKRINNMIVILREFLEDREKQSKTLPNVWSIQDLKGHPMEIEHLEISMGTIGEKSRDELAKEFLSRPHFVYAKPKNLDMVFVVDKIQPERLVRKEGISVSVNGSVLYDHIDVIWSRDDRTIRIGPNIMIRLERNRQATAQYQFQGTLGEQIKSLKLWCALVQHQDVKFSDGYGPIYNVDASQDAVNECTTRLSTLETIAQTLEELNVSKDLALGDLTDQDRQKLDYLVEGIHYNHPVPRDESNLHVGNLSIGNLKVLICMTDNPEGEGVYINDFFKADKLTLAPTGRPEEGVPVSPYVMMTAESLLTTDNANIAEIVPSITSVPYSEAYGNRVLNLALELLKLYDMQENAGILDTVIGLIDYLEGNDINHEQRDLLQLNRLQTEKRRRELTKGEVKYLMGLKRSDASQEYQLAASILLGSYQEAKVLYDLLDKEVKEEFDQYPIKNLWKSV